MLGAGVSFSSPSAAVQTLLDDPYFQASNKMYAINGAPLAALASMWDG